MKSYQVERSGASYMPLYKLKDYYPNYRQSAGNGIKDIEHYKVYTEGENQVGSAKDILVDQSGRFRYIVVDTGPWIFGKDVLLPVGLAHFDYNNDRIFVDGLTKQQVENLPAYRNVDTVDQTHENQIREQYRPLGKRRSNRQFMNQPYQGDATNRETETADYDREPALYGLSEQDNQKPLKLYEERLVTERNRVKTGEVTVGKHVETRTAEATVPTEKERVVIERHDASGKRVADGSHQFKDGEVAHMDVYEDEVDIGKEAFVREEVSVHKETDREQVKAKEKVRREELDVDTKGNPRTKR
jgi:uncharacterized protein (TIGR02271 family)